MTNKMNGSFQVRRAASLWLSVMVMVVAISSCTEENPGGLQEDGGIDPSLLVTLSDVYQQLPIAADCTPGEITDLEQQMAIAYINEVRARHGLAAVAHDPSHDQHTGEAALIIAVNDHISHNPPNTLACWTQEGALGSQKSNLAWAARLDDQPQKGFTSEYMIDSWWKDSTVEFVGHRRWLLDPFLQKVSFGRADRPGDASTYSATAAALWVIDDERPAPPDLTLDFVAWPFGNYPTELYNNGLSMSFSAIVNREDYWDNQNVDLTQASVSIVDESGKSIPVRSLRHSSEAFGLPNVLVWEADVVDGVRYDVTVSGVVYGGVERGYSYWFEVSP